MTNSATVGPGTVLADRYELSDVIGHGGFGTIWRARQLIMDRDVAIKILPPQFAEVKDVVERFKREAKLASRLRHPNTITLHDYGQHDDLLYIVMELLVGEDLADVLKREGRLPPDRIMHIARQVLKSLSEAHEQHIIHRDLKPENIFLSVVGDERDHVKVVDFGIAKLLQPDEESVEDVRRLTLSGSTVGTPAYMSPEQAAGEEVDGATDLYALGIIMYEMACGRPPFHDKDPMKVMRAQLFEPVPPLRDRKLIGTVLDRVIQKALAKDRDQRFKTAHEMLLALAGEPVARPVIQGIAAAQLLDDSAGVETSSEEVRLADFIEPNTGDYAYPGEGRGPETLSFVKSVSDEAEVPFDSVSEARERAPRSSGSQADAAITSSIVTVIEPGDEADVILLTRRKDEPAQPVAPDALDELETTHYRRDPAPAAPRALPPSPPARRLQKQTDPLVAWVVVGVIVALLVLVAYFAWPL